MVDTGDLAKADPMFPSFGSYVARYFGLHWPTSAGEQPQR